MNSREQSIRTRDDRFIQASPWNSAGRQALEVFAGVLEAVRPDRLIGRAVSWEGASLRIAGDLYRISDYDRILLMGAGKAAAVMAAAVETILGDALTEGLIVTRRGHTVPTRRVRVMEAAHPLPDESSLAAGRAILDLAGSARERDLVIFLLSGGASALMEAPEPGITLKDLQSITDLLLRAGAPIESLNSVRACLSRVKAGGLARASDPATVVCLVLSDVIGNRLDVIGSGPFCGSAGDPAAALRILARFNLLDHAPPGVIGALRAGRSSAARPAHAGAGARHAIIGDIEVALEGALETARRCGLRAFVLSSRLQGEAREVGTVLGGIGARLPQIARETEFNCLIAGGETTVTVTGSGRGGRCQELAASAAESLAGAPDVALLAAGTDGADGPTDAAGAIVDGDSRARAAEGGRPLADALRDNDSYAALQAAGALIRTGPTHTNVGDIVVLCWHPESDPR